MNYNFSSDLLIAQQLPSPCNKMVTLKMSENKSMNSFKNCFKKILTCTDVTSSTDLINELVSSAQAQKQIQITSVNIFKVPDSVPTLKYFPHIYTYPLNLHMLNDH